MSTDVRREASPRARAARFWVVVTLATLCQACEGVATYGQDRRRDLSDVVDVRYGTGVGLGVMLEAGPFTTGLGSSSEWYYPRWYGRKPVEVRDGLFAFGIVAGYDGDYIRRLGRHDWVAQGDSSTGNFAILLLNLSAGTQRPMSGTEEWFTQPGGDPPLLTCASLGGTLFLLVANAGLYFNAGEALDFVCGVAGADPMHDDGVPKFEVATGSDTAPVGTPPAAPAR